MAPASTPAATYRLQFNSTFTFDAATQLVDYLDALGIDSDEAMEFLGIITAIRRATRPKPPNCAPNTTAKKKSS